VPHVSVAAVHQCSIKALNQFPFFERLKQVTDRAVSMDVCVLSLVRKRGNKYHRDIMTNGNQVVIQFNSAQAGHLDVSD